MVENLLFAVDLILAPSFVAFLGHHGHVTVNPSSCKILGQVTAIVALCFQHLLLINSSMTSYLYSFKH